jgi:hypothetical protein
MATNLKPPEELDLFSANLAETWKSWRRQMELYLLASGVKEKEGKTQVAVLLHCAGVQAQEVFDNFTFGQRESKNNPDHVFQKFEEYCKPITNEVMESFRFWNTPCDNNFESFLTSLRSRAKLCNFGNMSDRLLRDKIVFSVSGRKQELLMKEKELDLKKAIDICRLHDATQRNTQEMKSKSAQSLETSSGSHIDKVQPQKSARPNLPAKNASMITNCGYCGRDHAAKKTSCPAWGKVCNKCKIKNHFAEVCRRVHEVSAEMSMSASSETEEHETLAVGVEQQCEGPAILAVDSSNAKRVTALLQVNGHDVRFQLDSAAEVNTIAERHVKENQIQPTK